MPPKGHNKSGLATRKRVLEYYRDHLVPPPTLREVAHDLGISANNVDYHRRRLIEDGYLAHQGGSRGTFFVKMPHETDPEPST